MELIMKKKILSLCLLGALSSSAFAYTQLQPIKLDNGLIINSQINSNNAQMAEQQGCDYENVYKPLWNHYGTTVGTMLNNTDSTNSLSNIQDLSQQANIDSCLNGPIGQISGMAGNLQSVLGILSGDISTAKALSWASTQAKNQACSIASSMANKAINQSGVNQIVGGASNVVNTPVGPLNNTISGITSAISQQPPQPQLPINSPLNLLK